MKRFLFSILAVVAMLATSACGSGKAKLQTDRDSSATFYNYAPFYWQGLNSTHTNAQPTTLFGDRTDHNLLPDWGAANTLINNPSWPLWFPQVNFWGSPAAGLSVTSGAPEAATYYYHVFAIGQDYDMTGQNRLYNINPETGTLYPGMNPWEMIGSGGLNMSTPWTGAPLNGPWATPTGLANSEVEVAAVGAVGHLNLWQCTGPGAWGLDTLPGKPHLLWGGDLPARPWLQFKQGDYQFGSPIACRADFNHKGRVDYRLPQVPPERIDEEGGNTHNYIWTTWREHGGVFNVLGMCDPLDTSGTPEWARPSGDQSYSWLLAGRNSTSTPAIAHWDSGDCNEGLAMIITVPDSDPTTAQLESLCIDSEHVFAGGSPERDVSDDTFPWYDCSLGGPDMPLVSPVVCPYNGIGDGSKRVLVSTPSGIRVYKVMPDGEIIGPTLVIPPSAPDYIIRSQPCAVDFLGGWNGFAFIEERQVPGSSTTSWRVRLVRFFGSNPNDSFVDFWVGDSFQGVNYSQPYHDGDGSIWVYADDRAYAFQSIIPGSLVPGPVNCIWFSNIATSFTGWNRSSICAPVGPSSDDKKMYVTSPEGTVYEYSSP
jgi:hypothetical protein